MSQYFYDKQFRRYLLQVVRIFSEFEVSTGKNRNTTKVVPCMMGSISTIAADALRQNSENTLLPIPLISVYVTGLQLNDEMRHAPWVEGKTQFTEKAKDSEGKYINKPGYKWDIKQHMAVPFKMEFNVDIATSSMNQKMELLEQILVLFNPGFNIKINKSPFDAHNMSFIKLTNVQWSSKTPPDVPIDGSNEFSTLTFEIDPVWLGTPAKIKKQSLIQHIVTNIDVGENDETGSFLSSFTDRLVIKPTEHAIEVYKESGSYKAKIVDSNGIYMKWKDFYEIYPDINEDSSYIRIRQDDDISNTLYDLYVNYEHTNDEYVNTLYIDERTIPETDIEPVDKIINPQVTLPNNELEGTRYLVVDIPSDAWDVDASEGDIIEYNGTIWTVSFDASEESIDSIHYVLNKARQDVYKFIERSWINAISGTYSEEMWFFDVQVVRGNGC